MDTSLNSPRRHPVKITYGKRKQEGESKTNRYSFPFSSDLVTTTPPPTPPTKRLRLFRTETDKKIGPRSKSKRDEVKGSNSKPVKEEWTEPPQMEKTPVKRGRKPLHPNGLHKSSEVQKLETPKISDQNPTRKRGRPRRKKSSDEEVEFLGGNESFDSIRKSNRLTSPSRRSFQTDLPLYPASGSLVVLCVEIPPRVTHSSEKLNQEKLVVTLKVNQEPVEVNHTVEETDENELVTEIKEGSVDTPLADEETKQGLVLSLAEKTMGPTTCAECGLSFNLDEDSSDASHERFHKAILHGIDYPGYKHDQVVEFFADEGDSIIVISKQSGARERKRAKEIVHYINTYLGSTDLNDSRLDECKIYIYVRAKRVIGCVVAEPIDLAYRLRLPSDGVASTSATEPQQSTEVENQGESEGKMDTKDKQLEPTPTQLDSVPISAICGIHRMWVCSSQRQQGIASRILDTVCKNFLYGCPLRRHELAFSQPTPSGKAFAQSYTNTAKYLVYVEKA
ncbi:hypothetical protein K7432_014383 [Basidiobolus ranarum]|uniref:Uncharacterized protein n=1 Tax=Basidiobolus ranarum TaxID=34480 RepID=A0ABR2WHQ0_9FUNG